ncbi:MAG: reverse transcriptase family protein [bacterium]|nr:reverse transcriptase family protein [bacterium]
MDRIIKPKVSSVDELAHVLKIGIKDLVQTSKAAGKYYRPFDMRKLNSKKWRHIDNPTSKLKVIQKKINKRILRDTMLQLPSNIIGGVLGKRTLDNAKPHVGQKMVLSLDIRDCFPRTRHKKVYKIWKEFFEFDWNSARILTQLTTLGTHLPQGSSASLALSNLALLDLFEEINQYSNRYNLNFTMYVDDITISGDSKPVLQAIHPLIRVIQKHGYAVRSRKIDKMPSSRPQIITGIQTNKKISIDKYTINAIRQQVINFAKGGEQYISRRSVMSKIGYIKTVSPEKGEKLLEFANMLLPQNIVIDFKVSRGDEIRRCNGKNCLAP